MDEIFVWGCGIGAAGRVVGVGEVVSDEVEDLDRDPGFAVSEVDFRIWDDADWVCSSGGLVEGWKVTVRLGGMLVVLLTGGFGYTGGREKGWSWSDKRGGFHSLPVHFTREAQTSLQGEIHSITARTIPLCPSQRNGDAE